MPTFFKREQMSWDGQFCLESFTSDGKHHTSFNSGVCLFKALRTNLEKIDCTWKKIWIVCVT